MKNWIAAFPLAFVAACNSDVPPPLTGNLTDARGAHAGSFRAAGNGTGKVTGDHGSAAASLHPAGNDAAIEDASITRPRKPD